MDGRFSLDDMDSDGWCGHQRGQTLTAGLSGSAVEAGHPDHGSPNEGNESDKASTAVSMPKNPT